MYLMKLPKSECIYGHTADEVKNLTGTQYEEFSYWMSGQAMAICDGERYNYETQQMEPTGCGPHGVVVYTWDLQRFLDGGPILD